MAIVLISPAAIATQPITPSGQAWASGQLSRDEANSLAYLSYPQTYADMKGRYGYPAYRDGNTDYYQVEEHWLAIEYNAQNQATGFSFWTDQ
jgi:hypothetical protein